VTTDPAPKGIAAKLLQIQRTLEVEKTGYDERNEYNYFKADDILNSAKAMLNQLGIITRTRVLKWNDDNFYDNNGRGRPRVTAEVEVTYIDVESGEEFATSVVATGSDIGGDKAPRKLHTQAKKESLIETFNITEESEKFDSDGAPEQEPANMQPPVESDPEAGLDLPQLQAKIGEFISSGVTDGPTINGLGTHFAKELGVPEEPKSWRRDINVLTKIVTLVSEKAKTGEVVEVPA